MAVQTKKFEFNKDFPVEEVNRFYQTQSIDRTQILDVTVIQKTPNAGVYIVTYEDVITPFVVGSSPANGADSIPANSQIIFQFSEAVQNMVATDVEVLRDGVVVALVDGDIATSGSVSVISNAIDSSLGANYVVTLKTTIQDANGNQMAHPYVLGFTTASQSAGVLHRGDSTQPTGVDISNGYMDVLFGDAMPNGNYVVPMPGLEFVAPAPSGAVIYGTPFHITNRIAAGFRINFDFPLPSGALVHWLAIHGIPS